MSTQINDLATPCFLVDRERVQANCQRMLDRCKRLGVSLRSHTKTHKTVEFGEMATGGTKKGLTVSTLTEAEMFADAGFDDILYAFPITKQKLDRCAKLMSRLSEFHVMVSDLAGVECLKANMDKLPAGKTWSVVIELDCGYGRTGFSPSCSNDYIEAVREVRKTMNLLALYCHCGDSYDVFTRKDREAHNKSTVEQLKGAKETLLKEFPDAKFIIGVGSTPACNQPSEVYREVDEFHPGNYVFNDYEQYLLNSCRQDEIACRVMTRVVAHKEEKNMLIVDMGFTALGHDGIHERPNDFCLIDGESNLKVIGMCQELGKIIAKEGDLNCEKYPVGTIIFIYPYHSCLTASLHGTYHLTSGQEVVGTVKPCRGW